jgi:hypothetical protein
MYTNQVTIRTYTFTAASAAAVEIKKTSAIGKADAAADAKVQSLTDAAAKKGSKKSVSKLDAAVAKARSGGYDAAAGDILVTCGDDRRACLWDLGRYVRHFCSLTLICCCCLLLLFDILVTCGDDRRACLWDLGRQVRFFSF